MNIYIKGGGPAGLLLANKILSKSILGKDVNVFMTEKNILNGGLIRHGVSPD